MDWFLVTLRFAEDEDTASTRSLSEAERPLTVTPHAMVMKRSILIFYRDRLQIF